MGFIDLVRQTRSISINPVEPEGNEPDVLDDGVGQLLPAPVLVRVRVALSDGQAGVQKKHALEKKQP
jgi:hypothetical protein